MQFEQYISHPAAKIVHDIDSVQLIATLKKMRDEKQFDSGDDIRNTKKSELVEPKIFIGAANKSELNFFEDKFKKLKAELYLASMEEKLTIKGTALDLWLDKFEQTPDFIYSCGPEKMLESLKNKAINKNILGEVSLERRMGCGIGVCLSCLIDGFRVCQDGPVVDSEKLAELDEFGNWERGDSGKREKI